LLLARQEGKRPGGFLLLGREWAGPEDFSFREPGLDGLKQLQLFLRSLFIGAVFLDAGFQFFDPLLNNVEVGQYQVVFEPAGVGQAVSAGVCRNHVHQRVGFAHDGNLLVVALSLLARQTGRVEQLDLGRRDLLGLVQLDQIVKARVGQHGHARLARVRFGRVGFHSREQFENAALAAGLVSYESDFHKFTKKIARVRPPRTHACNGRFPA
jgi:hypothetical protein